MGAVVQSKGLEKPLPGTSFTILEKKKSVLLCITTKSCFGLLSLKALKQVLNFSVLRHLLWQGSLPHHTILDVLQIGEIRLIDGLFMFSILSI